MSVKCEQYSLGRSCSLYAAANKSYVQYISMIGHLIFKRLQFPGVQYWRKTLTFSRVPENTGHFASREGIARDAGQRPWNTGRPGKYGTVGNPTPPLRQTSVIDEGDFIELSARYLTSVKRITLVCIAHSYNKTSSARLFDRALTTYKQVSK